jgi:uncharacterized integral membrane protein
MVDFPDSSEPEPDEVQGEEGPFEEEPVGPPSTGIAWGAILLLLGIALVVVFSVQNTDAVPVTFLWMDGEYSLAIVILVTVGVAILVTELVGLSYRRRRRRRRAESEELQRYRRSS